MKTDVAQNKTVRKADTQLKSRQKGFTLIEMMVVTAIIGLLASFASTSYRDFIVKAELSEMANQLGKYSRDFSIWAQVNGRFPNDSHVILPPDAPGLPISPTEWAETTGLGGNWNWEGPDNYEYAGISIVGATAPEEHIEKFDSLVDDGNLSSGKFRRTAGGRLTYIIEEN